ncbi:MULTISPECIES: hypothetical protein [Acinetobacter]|uniref:hypothetical protein n=1 Tax=Acinetobacter TaxID=469 RepID=UPI000537598B|nr:MULTISPECIES: hypothetical protein [Acinetobacter]KGT46516.1 hypothetical protein GW12_24470 [Acinetobacter sp. HR7]MEB5930213.1 hypothetical protein [Acinetobacter schindleri]
MNITSGRDDVFSIATLLYARLRKVNSRVIDVMYLMQDRSYAHHVITLALETRDAELATHVERLRQLLDLPDDEQLERGNYENIQDDVARKGGSAKYDEGHVSFSLF